MNVVRLTGWLIGVVVVAAVVIVGAIVAKFLMPASDAPPLRGWTAEIELVDPPRQTPDTPFLTADGSEIGLDGFRGKVVLLNFWATWCAPCVREMPELDRLQEALGGDDFAVIAVSSDRGGLDDVRPFYERLGLEHLDIYLDPRAGFTRSFGVAVMPTTALIDRQGRVVALYEGAADWASPEVKDLIRWYQEREG